MRCGQFFARNFLLHFKWEGLQWRHWLRDLLPQEDQEVGRKSCRYEFDISMCHLISRIHFGGVCIDNATILAFGSSYCLSKVYMIVIGFWQTRKRNARKSRHLF